MIVEVFSVTVVEIEVFRKKGKPKEEKADEK